jgi:hypothetical protein
MLRFVFSLLSAAGLRAIAWFCWVFGLEISGGKLMSNHHAMPNSIQQLEFKLEAGIRPAYFMQNIWLGGSKRWCAVASQLYQETLKVKRYAIIYIHSAGYRFRPGDSQ